MKRYSELGQITLGSQLRIFSETLTADVVNIYEQFEVELDPKWFPVFYVLASEPDSTITSIAKEIGHSHVSVSKIVNEMNRAGLIRSRKCKIDSRRTLLNLTPDAEKMVQKLIQQCEKVGQALDQLIEDTGVDLWQALTVTKRHLQYFPLSQRVRSLEKKSDLRIVDFAPKYFEDFKRLNIEWISKYWELETEDKKIIDHPEKYILNRGGVILMAIYKSDAVGSVALIPYDKKTVELAKMSVSSAFQGKGIGLALAEFAINRAHKMGAKRVYLESNSQLTAALSLYRKLGFKEIIDAGHCSPYARCNVRMEKLLDKDKADE